MPDVKPNEGQQAFVDRCIPICIKEGLTKEQASGKCYGMWRNKHKHAGMKGYHKK